MSGHVPYFIAKKAHVLVDGKPDVVKDYYFTSGPFGMHNSDTLMLKLKSGKEIEFDYDRVEQPPVKVPDYIQEGKKVRLPGKMVQGGVDVKGSEAWLWEVESCDVLLIEGRKKPDIHLTLKRPGKGGRPGMRMRMEFNEKAVVPAKAPAKKESAAKKAVNPAALPQDILAPKPLDFSKKPTI